MQNERFHNRISWLMFLFSILVIWVHSYNVELFAGTEWGPAWECVAQIETFWSVGVGQIAVPGFFMLSSYLFFRNFRMDHLFDKWKSRCMSVLVPYITWNFLYYLGYVIATRLPFVQKVVGKDPIPFSVEEILQAIGRYSYAPIFWYLFQLIILLALAPLIYIFVRSQLVGLVYLTVILALIYVRFDTGFPNMDALFYFSFAAYMAVHHRDWLEEKRNGDRALTGILLLIAAVYSYGMMKIPGANVLWTIVYRWFVPSALWLLISSTELPETRSWMRMSLFLYAIHFMVVRFMNKGTALVLGKLLTEQKLWSEAIPGIALGVYFALPVCVIIVSYGAARILERYLPVIWRILSGGRKL